MLSSSCSRLPSSNLLLWVSVLSTCFWSCCASCLAEASCCLMLLVFCSSCFSFSVIKISRERTRSLCALSLSLSWTATLSDILRLSSLSLPTSVSLSAASLTILSTCPTRSVSLPSSWLSLWFWLEYRWTVCLATSNSCPPSTSSVCTENSTNRDNFSASSFACFLARFF